MRKSLLAPVAILLTAAFLVTACESAADKSGDAAANAGPGNAATAPNFSFDGASPGTGINQLAQDVPDRVFFATDSTEISSDARAVLAKQAEWLKSRTNLNITVAGNCDERGTREYNLALGQRRAVAAKDYLVSLGVPESKISTTSFGKERPAVDGNDEAAWAQNRNAIVSVQ